METLKSAIGLCVKIHEMYGTFTSNKVQCHWLLSLVKNIMESLNLQLARDAVPEALEETLLQLQEDLRACKTVLEEFGMCGRLKRFVLGYKHAQQFADAGTRLSMSYASFSHATQSHIGLDLRDLHLQTNAKLDAVMQALQQALQCDVQEYHEDLGRVMMQDLQASVKLTELGVSSRHRPLPALGDSSITTFEEAQGCSWCVARGVVVELWSCCCCCCCCCCCLLLFARCSSCVHCRCVTHCAGTCARKRSRSTPNGRARPRIVKK